MHLCTERFAEERIEVRRERDYERPKRKGGERKKKGEERRLVEGRGDKRAVD